MKSRFSYSICFWKLFLTPLLILNVISFQIGAVWAQSKSQLIAEQIQTLQKSNQRWIQINLSTQKLIAWEGEKSVYAVVISTGKKQTPTLTGIFEIQSKQKSSRMKGDEYDIPDVPYTMYYSGSYAIHGAYWHHNFGTRISHGCVNLAPNHAKWLFNWASVGTPVIISRN
ncbi:MAG: L,D-transpeptidase [Rhizonema sp. NSF051]|nr:L,D-transpeptidase [Rhizonema sp. NSF051]